MKVWRMMKTRIICYKMLTTVLIPPAIPNARILEFAVVSKEEVEQVKLRRYWHHKKMEENSQHK